MPSKRLNPFRRLTALICAISLCGLAVAPLQAAMVGTDTLIAAEQGQTDRERLLGLFEREDVKAELQALGVSPELASERVKQLTDAEVAELSGQLEALPAGADAGMVLGVVVFFALVFIVTDVIGATDIFPFIEPVID